MREVGLIIHYLMTKHWRSHLRVNTFKLKSKWAWHVFCPMEAIGLKWHFKMQKCQNMKRNNYHHSYSKENTNNYQYREKRQIRLQTESSKKHNNIQNSMQAYLQNIYWYKLVLDSYGKLNHASQNHRCALCQNKF